MRYACLVAILAICAIPTLATAAAPDQPSSAAAAALSPADVAWPDGAREVLDELTVLRDIGLAQVGAIVAPPVLAQVAAQVNPDDILTLLGQIKDAVQAHNWLLLGLLVPLVLVFVARKFGAKKIPWLATDAGGALLSLLSAVLLALLSAVLLPGPHTFMAIVAVAVPVLLHNQFLYKWLKKLFPFLADVLPDEPTDAPAPEQAKPASPPSALVPPAVALLVLLGSLLAPAPAQAQITWAAGPSVPLMLVEPGASHPVSIIPGAGLQLSFSDRRLTRAIGGKSWDMLDVTALAFGSLVKADSGAQFGQLSGALALCTMSSLVCIGGGKHLLTNDGVEPGRTGWFLVFALSFNLAIAPQSPPVGLPSSVGASGLVRANHLYLGGE